MSFKAFTLTADRLLNVLQTPVRLAVAFDPLSNQEPLHEFQAIWDTGATGSVITQRVVDLLGLKPTGFARVSTANGVANCETYLVNIMLPHQVGFTFVKVTKADLGPDMDVLIGMDIIGQGDLAVTNQGGKTVFSFRHPPGDHIDFGKFPAAPSMNSAVIPFVNPTPKIGRNEACPCGSQRKYKNCCGRNAA